jgi:hypothetical protein
LGFFSLVSQFFGISRARRLAGCGLLLLAAACQSRHETAETASPPPVGHYEGSLRAGQLAESRATLDIRHPSPGHYEAELTVAGASNLNFVADTILFANNQLRLRRPGRPGQVLSIGLEGDFWRGTLALDEVQAEVLLVKRGEPTPSTYRIEELPQAQGAAWLYAPADTQTPGAALALLPDSATVAAAPLWADALAREGFIVLVLPVADSTTGLPQAQRLLRATPGADTAAIGVWAAGQRAAALAQELAAGGRTAFFIAQNVPVSPASRTVFRALQQRRLPVLGLYGGPAAPADAGRLRAALGGRRRSTVHSYRDVAPDLRVPGGFGPHFGPGLPEEVVEWLRRL